MFRQILSWMVSHRSAILATIVAVQNSHTFSKGVENFLSGIGGALQLVA